jgi:uncharacterized SAM-binding protein YcdF (DUF218 family)
MKYLLELLFFPPGINIVIAVLGLALWNKRRRAAVMILAGDTALLYVFSLPFTAWALMSALQTFPPLNTQAVMNGTAQAIVVLGAGRYSDAPEYGGDTVSRFELERLRYGAHLQRLTHLPLMLVGGIAKAEEGRTPEALLMKEAATEDFGMDVTWTETRSHTTAENAANAAALLREHGIQHIYLVTHAWHMPRAVWSFQKAGITVTPAPTAFVTLKSDQHEFAWLPSARALYNVSLALHEMTGLLWYRLTLR